MDIATIYTKYKHDHAILKKRNTWAENYTLSDFIHITNKYIIPLLEKYGYTLGVSFLLFSRRLRNWCWAHTYAVETGKYVSIDEPIHAGTDDDYDWYRHYIDSDSWQALYDSCKLIGIFDDSDAGEAQKIDLPMFVWAQIDLHKSKTYTKTCVLRELYEDDEWTVGENITVADPE